jgi:glutathionylspermidine synthase
MVALGSVDTSTSVVFDDVAEAGPVLRAHDWDISHSGFRDLLRGLTFDYHKWDITVDDVCRVLPASIVISQSAHEEIVRATEAFASAIRRFEQKHRRERGVLGQLGIPRRLSPLLAAESERELSFCRADFFWTEDHRWVISEFNDDVPGGFNEAVGVHAMAGDAMLGGQTAGALREQLVAAFDGVDGVGIVFATAWSEDLQHCSLIEKWLSGAGHKTVMGSPAQLAYTRGSARLAGEPIRGVFRFYPGEWMSRLRNLRAWRSALPQLQMMSPPVKLLAQSKRAFAAWRTTHPLPADPEFDAGAYLPYTELFDARKSKEYKAAREAWVLKKAFGRMGDAVMVGALMRDVEWDKALREAYKSPGEYAMQSRFLVKPLAFAQGTMYPTIGAYAVNGRFAGYYSRVAPRPFITNEAYYVATVVENT